MLTDLKRTLVGATVSLTVGVAVLAAPVTAQAPCRVISLCSVPLTEPMDAHGPRRDLARPPEARWQIQEARTGRSHC